MDDGCGGRLHPAEKTGIGLLAERTFKICNIILAYCTGHEVWTSSDLCIVCLVLVMVTSHNSNILVKERKEVHMY